MTVSSCRSQCGSNGHNSRTCVPSAADESSSVALGGGSGEIMLFGVRVKVDPMRKSVSMNNLSQYEQPQELSNNAAADISASASAVATGYASADDAVHHKSDAGRERKRGVPWTEEEHKLFLLGLQKVGKGDWRGISRNFVKSRTPTQVASHAQKYFIRRSNLNRRRRRSSLFDITTDSVSAIPEQEELSHQDNLIWPVIQSSETPNICGFPVTPYHVSAGPMVFPIQMENKMENPTVGNADLVDNASKVLLCPIPVLPLSNPAPTRAEVNLSQKLANEDSMLSLGLSLSSDHQNQFSSRHSAFQVTQNFSNGDGMITVT